MREKKRESSRETERKREREKKRQKGTDGGREKAVGSFPRSTEMQLSYIPHASAFPSHARLLKPVEQRAAFADRSAYKCCRESIGRFYASENSLISRRARGVEFNRGNLSFSVRTVNTNDAYIFVERERVAVFSKSHNARISQVSYFNV